MEDEARERGHLNPTPPALPGPDALPSTPRPLTPEASQPAPSPSATQPGSIHTGLQPRHQREDAGRLTGSALRRYLLKSREAALRQSSRKQKSGYWRQISRPTSSRSRCFSFSPSVRTQGTISTRVAEAVLLTEAEVEATPIHLSRLRPTRLPARRPTHTAADRRTVRRLQTPKPRPRPPPRVRGRRPRGRPHDVPEVITPRELLRVSPPRPPGRSHGRPPREHPALPATRLSRKSGYPTAPSNCLYCGGEGDLCRSTGETTPPPPQLPGPACGTPGAREAARDCSPCDANPRRDGAQCRAAATPQSPSSRWAQRGGGDRCELCAKPKGKQGGTPLSLSFA